MRQGTPKTTHFEPWVTVEEAKRVLATMGKNWRNGYFEWDGEHFFWTPRGSEQHER